MSILLSQAKSWSTDGPRDDKDEKNEPKGDANEDSDAAFRAEPPAVVLLDDLHLVGILLELLGQVVHLLTCFE